MTTRKTLAMSVICFALLLCSSCAEIPKVELPVLEDYETQDTQVRKNSLKLGVVAGPYGKMFLDAIYPLYAPKGYVVELVYFDNYYEPNFALADGLIDMNMFQNYEYLNSFKFENNMDLSAISEIPTVPMGIYSDKYDSVVDLPDGATVAIPGDSTNMTRALILLSTADLISLDVSMDKEKITLNDITYNPKGLNLIPTVAHWLVDALERYDMAVINGNYAISGGLSVSDAIAAEQMSNHAYLNVIAVRTKDLGEPFVMDLISVLRSNEYKAQIVGTEGEYSCFQYPCNFRENGH